MAKYVKAGREVRRAMLALTPLVEPLSIDEAFLDLTGTERLHGMSAAKVLARFARAVERDIGITVSIGLSANKFLAKIASDMDKPRGFAVLGQDEAAAFLAPKPVGFIYGVGAVSAAKLAADGYRLIADLQRADAARPHAPLRRGRRAALASGARHRHARGRSGARHQKHFGGNHLRARHRRVPAARAASMGSDRTRFGAAEGQCARRLDRDARSSRAPISKSARGRARSATRRSLPRAFSPPAAICLRHEVGTTRFRLIGIGVSHLEDAAGDDLSDLIDRRAAEAEHAVDRLRAKFGKDAVVKGLALDED